LALRWRADGNEPASTSITLMAAHLIYIGKSVEVRLGPTHCAVLKTAGRKAMQVRVMSPPPL